MDDGLLEELPSFVDSRKYLYVKREAEYCWYILENDQVIWQSAKAFNGYLEGIQLRVVESESYGESQKLDFLLRSASGKKWTIRSGFDSWFSKSFLAAVSLVSDFSQLLTIVPKQGEKTIVFCDVWLGENKIRTAENKVEDTVGVAKDISEKFFPTVPFVYEKPNAVNPAKKDDSSTMGGTADEVKQALNTIPQSVDFGDIAAKQNLLIKELGWDQEVCRKFLEEKFGERSRQLLSDAQMFEFTRLLEDALNVPF